MKKISKAQFYSRLPQYPEEFPSDDFYFQLANILKSDIARDNLLKSYPESVVDQCVLSVIGYYQDIVADAGLWRSFVNACRHLYGKSLPFFKTGEDYIDYELNREDIHFIVWYSLCMYSSDRRVCSPWDQEISACVDALSQRLHALYDDAPYPEQYNALRELELGDNDDSQQVWMFASWLFLHSYLLPPAFALTLADILSEPGLDNPDNLAELRERIDKAMVESPSGPLALYLGEWIKLILKDDMSVVGSDMMRGVVVSPSDDSDKPHQYYEAFTKATGGAEIAFFPDYKSLNEFFIKSLGWDEGEKHLPALENERDFVLLVNRHKGMLAARNVARCIASPDNPLYDKEYAHNHAIDLLTVRGLCPADLLVYIMNRGWLPDAVFPGCDDNDVVADNADFIARCYLQQYYRGD